MCSYKRKLELEFKTSKQIVSIFLGLLRKNVKINNFMSRFGVKCKNQTMPILLSMCIQYIPLYTSVNIYLGSTYV